jgi:hypothetical protein
MKDARKRLTMNKQTTFRFYMERFKLKKLNEVRDKERYRAEISNRFAALEYLDVEVAINSAWETIRGNIKFLIQRETGLLLIEA